jgi:hypothetical protein
MDKTGPLGLKGGGEVIEKAVTERQQSDMHLQFDCFGK